MKAKKILLFMSFALAFGGNAAAQDAEPQLAAVLTDVTYPYARGQWSREQNEAWQQKYGPIIGINCPIPPCSAVSQDDAVKKASELGFNSVRKFLGGNNANEYIRNVEEWASMCDRHGMTLSPVFGFVWSFVGRTDEEKALKDLEVMVRQIVRHFRNDDRIIMWDIWNEPEWVDEEKTHKQMEWIKKIVTWCQQEGCTQPITSSIIWDAGINDTYLTDLRKYRQSVEALMDLHNFHDYSINENHNANMTVFVDRVNKIDNRMLVCTEALARVNGSGVARSLCDFAKYNVHFYTWGLYTCDNNWEVRWGRSVYYAWEPMFHNLLYADGDPYDPKELDEIKNFKFVPYGQNADKGAELTERWSERRAWKWYDAGETKGLTAIGFQQATTLLNRYAGKGLYNTMNVRLSFNDYVNGSDAFNKNFDDMLAAAGKAGITVVPTLLAASDLTRNNGVLANYVHNTILRYYNDARVSGWNVVSQNENTDETRLKDALRYIFRYSRYAFPCQPMFATAFVPTSFKADASADDAANLIWQLSDVVSYQTKGGAAVDDASLASLYTEYHRPTVCLGTKTLQGEFNKRHVNWFAAQALTDADVKAFAYTTLPAPEENYTARMEGWQAYAQMNQKAVKGLSYNSLAAALTGVKNLTKNGLYNSVQVQLDFDNYYRKQEQFFTDFNELLRLCGEAGMTVLPALINDTRGLRNSTALCNYVADMLERYDSDERILAWDLYNKPCTQSLDKTKISALIEALFAAAREKSPVKPVFATPMVSTTPFAANFDYIKAMEHGNEAAGWNKLTYGNSTVNMCYRIWCLSDVIAYASSQNSPELGWLNAVAYTFGRPLICTKWTVSKTEDAQKVLDVFRNMHVNWYAEGAIDEDKVSGFAYDPIITDHF